MTRLPELLRCPACARPLATYDGLGAPTPADLAAWRELTAEHRRVCPAPFVAAETEPDAVAPAG